MKKLLTLFSFAVLSNIAFCQIPSYYDNVNLSLTGMALKDELANKITTSHTNPTTYTQVWSVLQQADLDPNNSSNVLLVYGYENGTDAIVTNDLSRDKNNSGGNSGQWNREHVYPKSLATPELTTGSPGPGTDCHNLKPSDVDWNGTRGNKKFATGSGNSGVVGANWYPGDEWKGDVARILMYMYVRYNTQCKPGNVCVGNPVSVDLNMVDLLLTWNVEDPVNNYESNRNNVIYYTQGNRNPFIDNPYLATLIWGGSDAENTWSTYGVGIEENKTLEFSLYPNPTTNGQIYLSFNDFNLVSKISVFDLSGKVVETVSQTAISDNKITLNHLEKGIYFVKVSSEDQTITKKVVVK
ncbi:MAG: endonuclease [Putridiphycobacter sp.]